MNVLIADDEPVNRRLLEILLKKWGYSVTVASDGNEAWEALQGEARHRIAILDWMMPGMDGIQLCRKIRRDQSRPTMYVILLTARQATEDANGRFESVADDYLPKPYAAHELKARLRAASRIIELEDLLQSARDAIKVETTHDTLTGLWNRSAIMEILHRELHRANRQNITLALTIVDIKGLNEINRRHGHMAGDTALRETARRIRATVRIYDSVGRYGGGQFVIISPACDGAGASSLAQRIRSKLCDDLIRSFAGDFSISVSLGIAVGGKDLQATDIISAAESALIEAKKTGHANIEAALT
jgi:two-component system cell cycle response regulator